MGNEENENLTEDQQQESDDFDAAFEETVVVPEEDEDNSEEGTPDEEEEAPDGGSESDDEGEKSDDVDEGKPAVDNEALQKQADDNQKFGQDQARRAADAEKKLADAEAKLQEQEASKGFELDVDSLSDDVKDLIEDNPEIKVLVENAIKQAGTNNPDNEDIAALTSSVGELREYVDILGLQNKIMGGVVDTTTNKRVEGIPDLNILIAMPEYGQWMESERKKDSNFGSSSDPVVAIKEVNQFKKHLAAKGALKHDKKAKEEADKRNAAASGAVNVSSGGSASDGDENNKGFDETFDEIT